MGKNCNIELLRVIAGLLVVTGHLAGTYIIYDGIFDAGLLYVDGVSRCSVPIFFMITGYFLNSNKSIMKQYIKFAKKVLLPSFLTVLVCGMLVPYIVEMLLGTAEDIPTFKDMIIMILTGRIEEFQHCYQLWYIVELVKCYIFLPVLQMLCSDEERRAKIRRYILIIGMLFVVVVPSVNMMTGIDISSRFYYIPITVFMWYLLLGYEVKAWFDTHQKSNKGFVFGFLLFAFGSFGVFGYAYFRDYLIHGEVIRTYFANNFFFLTIASIGLFIALLNVRINGNVVKKIIERMGGTIFGIYLIHPVVYSVIWHMRIENMIDVVGRKIFFMIFVLTTFFGSMILIAIFKNILCYITSIKGKNGR